MQTLNVIKIGGKIIDQPSELNSALKDFASINGPKILIHGGGSSASAFLKQMGIEPKMVNGRRITDANTLKIVQMVYAGLINKNIVAQLQAFSCDAIGLSGADINAIQADKRPALPIDFGYVGDVKKVNAVSISKLINSGFVPVFCALSHDGKGQILNTNADTVAAEIAAAMSEFYETNLYLCFEKNGVLQDIENPDSVITQITPAIYEQLKKQKIIADGMLPKIDNAFNCLKRGVKNVFINHFNTLKQVGCNSEFSGTQINL